MKCHLCGKRFQTEGKNCGYCGAVVRSSVPVPLSSPKPEGDPIVDEALEKLLREKPRPLTIVRRRPLRRLLGRAVAGTVVFAVVMVVVAALSVIHNIRGLSERATRPETLRGLQGVLWIAGRYACLIGMPIGVVLGWLDWGFVVGGVIGAATFLACYFLTGFDATFDRMHPALLPPLLPLLGFAVGSLLAFHVRMRRD